MLLLVLAFLVLALAFWAGRRFLDPAANPAAQRLRGGLPWLLVLLMVALLSLGRGNPLGGFLLLGTLFGLPALRLYWQRLGRASPASEPGRPARPGGRMDVEEARQILGVPPGASREDIIAAHRRLMQRLHPDRGGSDYLAAQINQAKAVLLGS
ncbi:hypothetical protein SAMN02949497_3276 [Methylomagnum ishizawai]|uniref:J domain-containing protein n=1 Tax=Methylomagnum ishizawai TaxID=1760988 RepID=A0A1Y6CYZ3_9GAMM|nr:DnaJ domain-containing protein [Methylomagnum ishizawai]SMF95899.1 hypothetical protein SAMN02949497_3276 [Methylomagnum ishizawai]